MIQPNDLYTGNGFDIRVHEIRNGQVYYVKYKSDLRGNLNPETDDFSLLRKDVSEFETLLEKENGALVMEEINAK